MLESRTLFGRPGETLLVKVERAISEFRAGRPVLLRAGAQLALALSAELADAELVRNLDALAAGNGHLVLSPARLRRLGAKGRTEAGIFALPTIDLERVADLTLKLESRMDAPVAPASALDTAALELARLSLVLPAALVVPVTAEAVAGESLVEADIEAVNAYRAAQAASLRIVGRAPVPLEGAPETEFVVFRGGEGLRDQVAIIVGKPDLDTAVPVRLHSACLTGDLFGSLKCDCGDQLRETVQWMAENGGGILLYLDQEGRGNGISNKMRAYKLQSQGWDTYDADEVLGFDLDQRHFDFAATMLKQLGVTSVVALTNNPQKIGAIEAAGLEVAASQRVLGRPNAHNVRYLASKRDRAGHLIDMDALMARAAPKD
ncbi:GTP cyclohydrolase II RibA [Bosea sp. SSUT16]|jgi:GTP cyclohydrolase II|uniref:GTP cyclohydrolase-2 n=1 Tax=Bosea spartocytisi TaxID=2773451 RepID=A0A927ECU6_9HYPH|nr:GTP cyclohydrolase II RibA [Bosea spartocytisi]MBD3848469.1 GTP cyclohydrolase II RibA [Bosea spartocytisi]MCT4472818.1 GTP cyclohydrolase II RibA [Bosea spartocytisi]